MISHNRSGSCRNKVFTADAEDAERIFFYKKYLLNTAQLCWADENRFAKR